MFESHTVKQIFLWASLNIRNQCLNWYMYTTHGICDINQGNLQTAHFTQLEEQI